MTVQHVDLFGEQAGKEPVLLDVPTDFLTLSVVGTSSKHIEAVDAQPYMFVKKSNRTSWNKQVGGVEDLTPFSYLKRDDVAI